MSHLNGPQTLDETVRALDSQVFRSCVKDTQKHLLMRVLGSAVRLDTFYIIIWAQNTDPADANSANFKVVFSERGDVTGREQ